MTGSAVVGRDTNKAAGESIRNTTYSTIILVVVILLVVYRSPLLAMVPLVTIALSVFVSLRLIALLTNVPGLGFQVINITQVFIIVVLFGAGTDYCLFLIARYCEELGRGRSRIDCASRGDPPGRNGPGRERRHGDHRPGHALLFDVRQGQVHRADDRAEPGRRPAGGPYAGPRAACYGFRGAIFWPFPQPHHIAGRRARSRRAGAVAAGGFLGRGGRPRGRAIPLLILAVCLVVLAPLAVVGARTKSNHNQLSDLDPDRPSVIGATRSGATSPSAS